MNPPNPYPLPGPGTVGTPNVSSAYPYLGLAGLAQGFTHGIELGHEWGHQADQLEAQKGQQAAMLQMHKDQMDQTNQYHQGELQSRQNQLDFIKSQAAKVGQPILDENGNVIGYQTGKGGITKPAAVKGTKEDDMNAALTALQQAQDARDKLGYGSSTLTSLPGFLKNKALSIVPGTDVEAYKDSVLPTAAMQAKGLSGRSSWPEIEALTHVLGSLGGTKEFNDAQFDRMRAIIKARGGAGNAASATPQATAIYSTPQAQAIKAQYAAGKMTKAQATTALDALGQNGS